MELDFYCREEYTPMHYYEAMQVFAHIFGMPKLHPCCAAFPYDGLDQKGGEEPDSLLTVSSGGKTVGCYPLYLSDARQAALTEYGSSGALTALSNDRNLLKRHLYGILSDIYGYKSPWGVLTGVRPVKVLHKLFEAGLSEEEARARFRDFFFVAEKKTDICFETLKNQSRFIGGNKDDISFYLSIPFCPTICSYCTFGSSPVSRYMTRVDAYIDVLEKEIDFAASGIDKKKVTEIYIGGGTPTSVSPAQLERVLKIIDRHFDIGGLEEFCVEAGRPDTVTPEKLEAMKKYGVTRISINPQTMNDETLKRVGRHHTGAQTVNAFLLAREAGFENINMDIIAGLPGETAEDFARTLEGIKKLSPSGMTVHALALKRASRLSKDEDEKRQVATDQTELMCDMGSLAANEMGMRPYYLYRQKNCIGNNENVSYCREGFESPYNIHIMEEDRTVIACGAGAVTKTVKNGGSFIERFFNTKSVDEYLASLDEILRRKRTALERLSEER